MQPVDVMPYCKHACFPHLDKCEAREKHVCPTDVPYYGGINVFPHPGVHLDADFRVGQNALARISSRLDSSSHRSIVDC